MAEAGEFERVEMPEIPPMDESGTVDLWQIEYNLSLTVEQRVEQYFQWMEFVEAVREAGKRLYGMEHWTAVRAVTERLDG